MDLSVPADLNIELIFFCYKAKAPLPMSSIFAICVHRCFRCLVSELEAT